MNSRITIVSDTELILNQGRNAMARMIFLGDGVLRIDSCPNWDTEGRAAFGDCINCLEATGSFAALSDDSPVPYVGKQMRHGLGEYVTVLRYHPSSRFACCIEQSGGEIHKSIPINNLYGIGKPKPKARPYTPVEAAAHLGREISGDRGRDQGRVCAAAIEGVSVRWSLINAVPRDSTSVLFYSPLAADYVWMDDGSPCGILEI